MTKNLYQAGVNRRADRSAFDFPVGYDANAKRDLSEMVITTCGSEWTNVVRVKHEEKFGRYLSICILLKWK